MKLPFEAEYRQKFQERMDAIFDSNFWSEGAQTREFEEKFSTFCGGLHAATISSGGSGLLAILDYIDVAGQEVIVPANTFWATAQAVIKAGGTPVYADCNRSDLCMSYDDVVLRVTPRTKAVIIVHIGGHLAFDVEKIATFCRARGIHLIEDCAHVHGGWWNGKTGGHWGIAGSYSFYATKTMPLGEGGMVVSQDRNLIEWVKQYRSYGKRIVDGKVTYPVKNGFNFRISEMTAALGIVQLERLPMILEWKRQLAAKLDQIFDNRVRFPDGMSSGYYKYIVFDYPLKEVTGQVFGAGDFGYRIQNSAERRTNSEWVAENHRCVPIYYGWDHAAADVETLRRLLLG